LECSKQELKQQAATFPGHLGTTKSVARLGSGKVTMATLVFDSTRAAAFGLRSTVSCARQLLYKSGSVCIDLHVQPKPGSESVVVVGQLLDSLRPARRVGNIPVSLLRDGSAVSTKKTNDYGEFDFAFDSPDSLHIAFGLEDQETLVVPLPDAALAM
jgi:hypothetical protein